MNKYILLSLLGLGLISCNQTEDAKSIQETITTKKMEIVELENSIHDLEKKLADLGKTHEKGSILVGTVEVEPQRFVHYLDVTGNVETKLEAYISPEINGLIKSIDIQEGDFVRKGQIMAQIDTDMIERNIDEVKTQLELAKTVYKKQKELWDQQIGSEIQYLQAKTNKQSLEKKLEALQTQLQKANIKAPFDAYVEIIYQKVGEMGNPARQLFHIVNLNKLKVTSNISESHLPYIHKGDTAHVSFAVYPDIQLYVPIDVIGSVINPANRTFEIQIAIPNDEKLLKPNIIANVQIRDHAYDSVVVVPSIIVKNDANGNNYVYVVYKKDGKAFAKKTYVTSGQSYGNKTMIVDGLNDSDQLIVQGYNLVKNGSSIRIK
jgi:RND family efflux transporter MFP subunit